MLNHGESYRSRPTSKNGKTNLLTLFVESIDSRIRKKIGFSVSAIRF
jgi:hypothetical protein